MVIREGPSENPLREWPNEANNRRSVRLSGLDAAHVRLAECRECANTGHTECRLGPTSAISSLGAPTLGAWNTVSAWKEQIAPNLSGSVPHCFKAHLIFAIGAKRAHWALIAAA